MNFSDVQAIERVVRGLIDAVRYHADAQVVSSKILANADARRDGVSLPFPEVER